MSDSKNVFLFEVSLEVCKQVGSMYTVLLTKLKQVVNTFGTNYLLIGPLREHNTQFVAYERIPSHLTSMKAALDAQGISYRLGYWDVVARPTVILIDFLHRYQVDGLLYSLWVDYGVDSLASNNDYHEAVLFATVAAEVITIIGKTLVNKQLVAHFHECGAGVLYLKKRDAGMATVYTTHATILGRSLATAGRLIYDLPPDFNPNLAAKKYNVFAKHSLERAVARAADCFTTVGAIIADEAQLILGKYPDKVLFNGLDIASKSLNGENIPATRAKLIKIASKVLGTALPNDTSLFMTAGRYEMHNKGYDVLLQSLLELETRLPKEAPPIVVFFFIADKLQTNAESLLEVVLPDHSEQKLAQGLATHYIVNPAQDSILQLCRTLKLQATERKVHVVYCNAYLDGKDGVFDLKYQDLLPAFDLSIFASYYEPWGYAPLESLLYATPTITTDLTGFGCWVASLSQEHLQAVQLVARSKLSDAETIKALAEMLANFKLTETMRKQALAIAAVADWQYLYGAYVEAYEQALTANKLHVQTQGMGLQAATSIQEGAVITPRLRTFQYEGILPEPLAALREFAYNFWWSWHASGKRLLQKIDYALWEQVHHNPVHFLNLVATSALEQAAQNEDYLLLYHNVLKNCATQVTPFKELYSHSMLSPEHPIAYFCLEYGIDECLPIYSGGLGILAGDYLKAMSDLGVPTIAIGLFYKQGYFLQRIDASGEQVATYETWDTNQIPMRLVNDATGRPLLTSVDLLGRNVYMCAWEVKVGNVKLYLLDTNVPENNAPDRAITNSLYGGSREMRLMQEIILGIGGTRFILEKLQLQPAVYHLNEGHSAFLLLERIRYFCYQGLSFAESCEAVRHTAVFTTHTPVPAGNEAFPEDLISKYFANYVNALGISIEELLNFARAPDQNFSMTVLSLKLTLAANAVSTLHGKVARSMWQSVWPSFLVNEVPIGAVTNGVHINTWLGEPMKMLYRDYLDQDWVHRQHEEVLWEQIATIPDREFWRAHQTQKEQLLKVVTQLVIEQYLARDASKSLIEASLRCLKLDTLLIGISRRFTAYKRNGLFLWDKKRLAKIVTHAKRPVVILIAGKAHPEDSGGIALIHSIFDTLQDEMLQGHIIFLEEYNIGLAKLLVQGVDVWLNTPLLGREACGTSGMKVAINGGLNFSTLDGWWEEAYREEYGWEIKSYPTISNLAKRNEVENIVLLNTLETQVVPLYYSKKKAGYPLAWVQKMKAALAFISGQYNTSRMVRDYLQGFYVPVALQHERMVHNNFALLRALSAWQQDIVVKFNTVKIQAIIIEGVKDGKITYQGKINIRVLVDPGTVDPNELRAEFVVTKTVDEYEPHSAVIPLQSEAMREDGIITFSATYEVLDTGFYAYGIRILPYNAMLYRKQDAKVVYWG